MITDMISTAPGFQTSVNIAYDLFHSEKIRSLIPTTSVVQIFEDLLLSTDNASTNRARILIGAYGKGKSHIILSTLSFLSQKSAADHTFLLNKVKEVNPDLYEYAIQYLDSPKKLLPVVINGSSVSLIQSFMGGLYHALKDFNLTGLMPETHFQAAIKMISLWKAEYPDTLLHFQEIINMPVDEFTARLSDFDIEAYSTFEKIYPSLTAGSEFNPFSGFDVVELYTKVVDALPAAGYSGIFVVYDEFSKYLESSITKASISDVKMLQDFAEKCCRSGAKQLHLLLISHKEIQNYIDVLPKQKVDGWKGVSERFTHTHIHSDFSQIYEIVSQTIVKEPSAWNQFYHKYDHTFQGMVQKYRINPLFSECSDKELTTSVIGCYPLHPITTFVLPRISEKVAQNERTLFTFLSGQEVNTLSSILKRATKDFPLVTVDALYDYFAPQMRKEVYTSEIHQLYRLSASILSNFNPDTLHAKIIKTIALIYCLGQFERLAPTVDTILDIYVDDEINADVVKKAILDLVQKQCVVYLKRSNAFLKLKESSGINIYRTIDDLVEKRSNIMTNVDLLNSANLEPYAYPIQYNDQFEMTRFFQFVFINAHDILQAEDIPALVEQYDSDGVIFGVFADGDEDNSELSQMLCQKSKNTSRAVFVLSEKMDSLFNSLRTFDAVQILREDSCDDDVLFDEYDMIYQDLSEVIQHFISLYTHPEHHAAKYYYAGTEQPLFRKAHLSQLLSRICFEVYPHTPVINNEVLNKNKLTPVAHNSRTKLLFGLLATPLQPHLGLLGTGQEVSFMRSALITTGILQEDGSNVTINDVPGDQSLASVLHRIDNFLKSTQDRGKVPFSSLYHELTGTEAGIGIRKGLIPIYLAVVLRKYQDHIMIYDQFGEVGITPMLLNQINDNPAAYSVKLERWSDAKQAFTQALDKLFADYINDSEQVFNNYSYLTAAMGRWYLSLPKYAKESKRQYHGATAAEHFSAIGQENIRFLSLLKQPSIGAMDLLFVKIPKCFGFSEVSPELTGSVANAKQFFDQLKLRLEDALIEDVKHIFCSNMDIGSTLTSIATDWQEGLSATARSKLYPNTAERIFPVIEKITNNEYLFIENLAKILTGLRIEDWSEDTVHVFLSRLSEYKETIESESAQILSGQETVVLESQTSYSVTFVNADGHATQRTFERVARSKRSGILYNRIHNAIKEMGQSISPQEKRQVLMEILEELC